MLALNGIRLGDLKNQTIIILTSDLGCNIKYPSYPKNKYLHELIEKDNKGEEISDELQVKYDKEKERIDKEFDKLFDDYMDSLVNWLNDRGYIKNI